MIVEHTAMESSLNTHGWNGPLLFRGFRLAADWLTRNTDRVNALNVFPVPDGDTGTNMAMTMRAAIEAVKDDRLPVSDVSRILAHGALMGARGNSGVILSQFFRGFAAALQDHEVLTGSDLARALDTARSMAYKAVLKPVEGTMLTVIRGAADCANAAASRSSDPATVLRGALDGAERALESTPGLLDILRQAGVVDAGGQGIVYILEGLERAARGETEIPAEERDTRATGADEAFFDQISDVHGEDGFGYCTNFMVVGSRLDFDQVRDDISAMGQSAVIVGDDTTIKVHIHTEDPGRVLQYATTLGSLDQIKIDNMTRQSDELTQHRAERRLATPESEEHIVDGTIAVVAVASGDGLAAALRAMGATAIVSGGRSMNPSTRDLLQAVDRSPVDDVVILPNNGNIILTANQVASLSRRTVRVVPSVSVPQGLAALSAFNSSGTLESNARAMTNALGTVTTIEITRAVRDVELDGLAVSEGQAIGLINDKLRAASDDLAEVLRETFSQIEQPDAELVTVFTGADVQPSDVDVLQREVAAAFPEAELELQEGGQPFYRFVISIE